MPVGSEEYQATVPPAGDPFMIMAPRSTAGDDPSLHIEAGLTGFTVGAAGAGFTVHGPPDTVPTQPDSSFSTLIMV